VVFKVHGQRTERGRVIDWGWECRVDVFDYKRLHNK
jgi:hypothetical protein